MKASLSLGDGEKALCNAGQQLRPQGREGTSTHAKAGHRRESPRR